MRSASQPSIKRAPFYLSMPRGSLSMELEKTFATTAPPSMLNSAVPLGRVNPVGLGGLAGMVHDVWKMFLISNQFHNAMLG